MVNIPDTSQTAGIPSQWEDTINPVIPGLFTGDTPSPLTQDLVVAAGQTLAALTVMGFNGSKELVPAVDGTIAPVAILLAAINTSAGAKGAPTYRQGCFNPDLLKWDASYDTDAKKFAAFEGSPTPTNIIIRKVKSGSL